MPGPLLDGRTAVVTGGGGGIGRGISERFAAEGARVVVAEADEGRATATVAAIADAGGTAIAVVGDVREAETVDEVMATAADAFDTIDVLVNNVGHYGGGRGAFHESTPDDWLELYHVNLEHMLLGCRAAIPHMMDQGRGVIINLSSVEGFRALPSRAVYAAFKAAIDGLTKSLAVEYGQHGIRVNAIAPDVTETLQVPYSQMVRPDDQHLIPVWVPVGRFGTPDDLAGAALFLASDLSAFVTGTTVHADGGTWAAGGWFRTEEGGWTNRPRRA
jgi:NAD(P)-dependent dehydrogenase (short-subunit alcohol dehydrogenase family)